MNDKGVCRTAPSTPDLLNTSEIKTIKYELNYVSISSLAIFTNISFTLKIFKEQVCRIFFEEQGL